MRALMLVAVASFAAAAAENPKPPSAVKFVADVVLDDAGAWTGRIAERFPEVALNDDRRQALEKTYPGPWEWTQTGDFTGSGRPAVLLVRGSVSHVAEPTYLAKDLVLAEWTENRWRELVRLGKSGVGVSGDGVALPSDPKSEGYYVTFRMARTAVPDGQQKEEPVRLWLRVVGHDSKGHAVGQKALVFIAPGSSGYQIEILKPREPVPNGKPAK